MGTTLSLKSRKKTRHNSKAAALLARTDVCWLLVTCGSVRDARRIGVAALAARVAGCYDAYPRAEAGYFWPPERPGRVERARGALLVLTTLRSIVPDAIRLVRASHAERVPFLAVTNFAWVDQGYRAWLARACGV